MMFRNKTLWFIIFFFSVVDQLSAQEFRVKAALDAVPASGFYKIPISSELTGYTKADFSDLRIIDNNNRQEPFIIRESLPVISGGLFTEFPLLQTTTDSLTTTIEIACPIKQGNDHLSLVMANNAVEGTVSISGSNDRKQWFIIKENIFLKSSGQNTNGSFVQSVDFPFSRYQFYKLVINNEHTDPLNIIKAGLYSKETAIEGPDFIVNPPVSFVQKDSSNGLSYITMHQQEAYILERLLLKVDGPKFYKRKASLYCLNAQGVKEHISSFELTSGHQLVVSITQIKVRSLLLEIENNDNPPLLVREVKTEQVNRNMVAYLDKGKNYFVMAGNEKMTAPQYDLMLFRDSIPNKLATISYGDFKVNAPVIKPTHTSDKWSNWLWPAIVVVILVLGYLTYKLMTDMKKSGI